MDRAEGSSSEFGGDGACPLSAQPQTSQPHTETVEGVVSYEEVTVNDHAQIELNQNTQLAVWTLQDESGENQKNKAVKHRRRRRTRKKSAKWNDETNCKSLQEGIEDDVEYVVQEDWSVKSIPKKDFEGVHSKDIVEWEGSSVFDDRNSSGQWENVCAEDNGNDEGGNLGEASDHCADTSQKKRSPQISKIIDELSHLIVSVKNNEGDDQLQTTAVASTLGQNAKPKKPGFVLDETELNNFEGEFNKSEYLQDNTLEVLVVKNPEKDYLHVIVYECNGARKDPERISRNSFKICDSAIIASNSSEAAIKGALFEVAKRLEKISADSFDSDEKQPYEVSECSLEYLAKRRIVPLKKKSTRFTRAVYYCHLCHFHINSVGHAITHFETKEHQQIEQRNASLSKLSNLPIPCDAHLQSINDLLMRTLEKAEVEHRTYDDCEQLTEALQRNFKISVHQDCSLDLYGSYLVRSAYVGSDVNFSLKCPETLTPGQIVHRVCQSLANLPLERWRVSDVTTDLKCELPTILFCVNTKQQNDECQLRNVRVAISATRYVKTWRVIAVYARIKSFLQLSRLFQCWARTCSLNVTALGGLPSRAFHLMLIHFLQTKRLLPFLDEMIPQKEETETSPSVVDSAVDGEYDEEQMVLEIEKWNREWDIPRLWVELFRHYVLEHLTERLVQIRFDESDDGEERSKDASRFNCKRIAIEDPFSPKRIIQPSQYFVEYFLNCFYTTFLYFWIPRTPEGPLISYRICMLDTSTTTSPKKIKKKNVIKTMTTPKTVNNASGESSYQQITAANKVLDSRQQNKDELEHESDMWNDTSAQLVSGINEMQSNEIFPRIQENSSRFGDESVSVGRDTNAASSTRSVIGNSVKKSVDMSTEKCTGIEALSKDSSVDKAALNGDIRNRCYSRTMMMKLRENANYDFVSKEKLQELGLYCCWTLANTTSESDAVTPAEEVSSPDDGLTESNGGTQEKAVSNGNTDIKKTPTSSKEPEEATEFGLLIADINEEMVQEIWHKLRKEDLVFEWSLKTLVGDLKPRVRCTSCGLSGHLIDACPELQLPEVLPIRSMDRKQKDLVDLLLLTVYKRLCMNADYERLLKEFCSQLEVCLTTYYKNDCRLSLFGSAGNGFGLIGSDADICLRFGAESISGDVDPCEVIMEVAEKVKERMPGINSVTPITNAKVPIVKVQCSRMFSRLEADISLYNVLALENTRLLHSYSELDERARILGIFVKEWAKRCEIGDASRGSLSSYSIIVMLIHFLQRCNPPVLPFLQEIDSPISPKIEKIVDGCDVYFCSAINSGWQIINCQSISDLWFGFLDYFSQRFDFASEVIQIRRREPLSKLDKGWQGRPIAIEDPFELQHNLSSGVHLRTMVYIQRSFIQSRDHFGRIRLPTRPLNDFTIDRFLNNLFSACHVNSGPPLARNCCHRCKQIGHFVENCPLMQQKGHRRRTADITSNQPTPIRQTLTAVNHPKELGIGSAPKQLANVSDLREMQQLLYKNAAMATRDLRRLQRLNSNGQSSDRNGRGGRRGAPVVMSTTPQQMVVNKSNENVDHSFVIVRVNDNDSGHRNRLSAVNTPLNTRGRTDFRGGYHQRVGRGNVRDVRNPVDASLVLPHMNADNTTQ